MSTNYYSRNAINLSHLHAVPHSVDLYLGGSDAECFYVDLLKAFLYIGPDDSPPSRYPGYVHGLDESAEKHDIHGPGVAQTCRDLSRLEYRYFRFMYQLIQNSLGVLWRAPC